MPEELPAFDEWKLATPPRYEPEAWDDEPLLTCPHCGDELDSDYICVDCGAVEPVGEQSREDWLEQEADRKRDEL